MMIINDKIYGFFLFDTIKPTNTHIGVKYIDKMKIKDMLIKKVFSKLPLALKAAIKPPKILAIKIYNIG